METIKKEQRTNNDQSTSAIPTTPRAFIFYAREDGEAFAEELSQRLQREEPEITFWRDRSGCRSWHQTCPPVTWRAPGLLPLLAARPAAEALADPGFPAATLRGLQAAARNNTTALDTGAARLLMAHPPDDRNDLERVRTASEVRHQRKN